MVRSITIIPLRNRLPWNPSQVGYYICNPPHPQTAKRPGTQRDPTPPSSDSSVQTSSQTSHRNHQSHHLSSALPWPSWPAPKHGGTFALLKRPATQWVSGKFQELMDAWKESLWCWETPTRQSCSTLEIGKKSTNKHTKKIKHHRFPGLKIMLNHDKSTWCSGIIQSSVVKSSPWASTVPSLLAEKTEWRCHNHGHRKASSCPYQTSTKNTAESK